MTDPPNDKLGYFQETPATAGRRIFGIAGTGFLRVVLGIIVWFITKEDNQQKDGLYKRVGDDFAKMLKGDK